MRYLFVHVTSRTPLYCHQDHHAAGTIVPTKRDSDVIFCLHLLSKKITCSPQLSLRESIDDMWINPILWIGLIHK